MPEKVDIGYNEVKMMVSVSAHIKGEITTKDGETKEFNTSKNLGMFDKKDLKDGEKIKQSAKEKIDNLQDTFSQEQGVTSDLANLYIDKIYCKSVNPSL